MSTTWVFLGMLAGRELAIRSMFRMRQHSEDSTEHLSKGNVAGMIFSDLGKATIGLVVSILLVILLYVVEGRDLTLLLG